MSARTVATAPILLVEDEEVNRSLVRAVIAKAEAKGIGRFELHEATRLAEARRILSAIRLQIILLDVRLPDGDGLDIASDVHAGAAVGRPWIVVLTASVQPRERKRAQRAGVDIFVSKPYKPAELMSILGRLAHADPPRRTHQAG